MTAAWRTGFYRQRQGRGLSSTPFHRSSPSVISRLIKAGKLLSSTRPCRIIRAMPSVSRTATSVKPSTQGWSRTNDVRFRKPALYSTELQGCMPSRRGDVATRLPIRRLTSSFRYSSWRCDLPRLPLLGRWCLACVPHGRFDLCARPPEQKFRQPVGLSPTFPQSQRLLTCPPWDSNPQPKV